MTKKPLLPLAALVVATLLVAALVGVMALALVSEEQDPVAETSLVRRTTSPAGMVLPEPSSVTADLPAATLAPVPIDAPILPMGPEMIIGRVLDSETGRPVPAFQITILPHSTEPVPLRLSRGEVNPVPVRAPSGIFRFKSDPGHWDVVVRAPGYEPFVLDDVAVPRADGSPIEIRLSHGPSLTGLVHDQHNFPVVGAQVYLKVTRLFDDVPPPRHMIALTDQHGRFRFSPLPAGEYSLVLLEPDNPVDRLSGILVDGSTTDVTVFLAPRHEFMASVQDGYGRPVRDARVEITSLAQHASGRTSPSGQTLLSWLQDGFYTVKVSRAGYETTTEQVVLEGGQGQMVRWYTLRAEGER
jgi:hypothetical protein